MPSSTFPSNHFISHILEILDFLSPVLRREIKCFTAREICQKVPLLFNRSAKEFAADISSILEPTIVFANEVILREGQTGDEMFFICSGVVEIFVSGSGQVASYVSIGDGCVSLVKSKMPSLFELIEATNSLLFATQVLWRGVGFAWSEADGLCQDQDAVLALPREEK